MQRKYTGTLYRGDRGYIFESPGISFKLTVGKSVPPIPAGNYDIWVTESKYRFVKDGRIIEGIRRSLVDCVECKN